jgi:hypothetical protein
VSPPECTAAQDADEEDDVENLGGTKNSRIQLYVHISLMRSGLKKKIL